MQPVLHYLLSHTCEQQLDVRKGEAAEQRGCGFSAVYCISARKLQNASHLHCEPLEPCPAVWDKCSTSAFAFSFLQLYVMLYVNVMLFHHLVRRPSLLGSGILSPWNCKT